MMVIKNVSLANRGACCSGPLHALGKGGWLKFQGGTFAVTLN